MSEIDAQHPSFMDYGKISPLSSLLASTIRGFCAVISLGSMLAIAFPAFCLADPAPYQYKLIDVELDLENDFLPTSNIHMEIQATNDAAASRIAQQSVPYIESLQDVEVVEAYTLKADGQKIPVDPSAIYTQQPQGIPQGPMFNDIKQKVIVFPQVSAGDTVVYKVKSTTKKALFPGQLLTGAYFPTAVPMQQVHETIIAPESIPLYTETHGLSFRKRHIGNNVSYSWDYSAPEAEPEKIILISPSAKMPRYYVSTFKNYDQFSREYSKLIEPEMVVTPTVQALANKIIAGTAGHREQAQAIYAWVSRHIRYVGIELGQAAIVPRNPDAIINTGYGDCKDHAILFTTLLKAIGIQGELALINLGYEFELPDIPDIGILNHVITYLPEFDLYADTTAMVAPFGVLPYEEYAKPVVHVLTTGEVLRTTPLLPEGASSVTAKTVAQMNADGTMTATTTNTATGPAAIRLRYMGLSIQSLGPETAATRVLAAMGYQNATGRFDAPSPMDPGPSYTVTGQMTATNTSAIMAGESGFNMPVGLRIFSSPGDGPMGPLHPGKLQDSEPVPCISDTSIEDISLQAPPGREFRKVPDDIKVETDNLQFTAHWELLNENLLTVHREFRSKIDKPVCEGRVRTESAKALRAISENYDTAIGLKRQ